MLQQKEYVFLSGTLHRILDQLAIIINYKELEEYAGHTNGIHLLVNLIGLVICRSIEATMTGISKSGRFRKLLSPGPKTQKMD